ncbi:MAG: S9 family peptidase [Flavobacteriales bacterium]|nr:S9 family peptidase [Flavobacteriales bacterium]
MLQRTAFATAALGLALLLSPALHAQKELTNRDIWYSPLFSAEFVGGLASMNDGEHYTALEADEQGPVIKRYAYRSGEVVDVVLRGSELVPAGAKEPVEMDGYSFSGDERMLMIETGSEPLYRYSYFAQHYVFDRGTRSLRPLSDPKGPKQRLATFSPDGSKAAFVRDNDLYVVDLASMKETRVTTDGAWNKVLNGATDWVYEEEFALTQGYAWSPTGNKLLYLRSDESGVREFNMAMYQGRLYPEDQRFKYPKAGEDNSVVSLHVFDIASGRSMRIPHGMEYIPRLGFTANEDVLWFMRMDRLQQTKEICTVDLRQRADPPVPNVVYRETSKTYVEVTDDLHFTADGKGFVLTSERNGWNHIYYVPMGGTPKAITSGNWDVVEVKGIDEKGRRVIFTASRNAPQQQEVWAVELEGRGLRELSPKGGFNNAEFSTGFRFFINTRSTLNTVPVITLHEGSGKLVKTLKDNARLQKTAAEYGLVEREFFSLTTEGGVALNGWMLKPPGFQSSQRYPVFMAQYSGPNSNEVKDSWSGRNHLWYSMLAQKGYVVVCVDGRGTGRRGRDFRHVTYGQLGKYETEDQIGAARWLAKQPWVDAERIGIWGWSYGGYMSSLCITKGADVFKAAIAVAPVTNWRYYDSIYTERYMGLPKDNGEGYDSNSPINHVDKLKGNYLLIHGMGDDNVHFQNAAEMINALVKANKQFDQFSYPDRNHGIYGGTTRMHLYELMTEWLERKL